MIWHSTLESLAWREKMGREGPVGGSGQRPCGVTCGAVAEGDPAASTRRGGGGRCRVALVAMACEKDPGRWSPGSWAAAGRLSWPSPI
jgi:hypothetical protein